MRLTLHQVRSYMSCSRDTRKARFRKIKLRRRVSGDVVTDYNVVTMLDQLTSTIAEATGACLLHWDESRGVDAPLNRHIVTDYKVPSKV